MKFLACHDLPSEMRAAYRVVFGVRGSGFGVLEGDKTIIEVRHAMPTGTESTAAARPRAVNNQFLNSRSLSLCPSLLSQLDSCDP